MEPSSLTLTPSADYACEALLASLRRLTRVMDLRSRYLAQHHGLTGPQLLVLRELERLGQIVVGRLAEAISVSQATVTGILDRLERKSLVRRRRDQVDKRRVLVEVTEEGRQALKTPPSLLHESFVQQFSRLELWEQSLILSSLQRLVAMMESAGASAPQVLSEAQPDRQEA